MTSTLHEKRFEAAVASKGISSDPIYKLAFSVLTSSQVHGDMLEFGAGTGAFITQLRNSIYQGSITGADILSRPESLQSEIQWIQADLNYSMSVPDASFDVIVSTEVIEHLENPRAIFREFYRLLRPGGKLLITTPNQESLRSLSSLILTSHFVAFQDSCYPAHITALLRKDFQRICSETNFSSPQFYYTDSGGIPKLPHIFWQTVSFNLLKGRLFSDNVALLTQKPL
jgi:2-polyprenyl-3-methyl-5-hydroxy-6-metoxy-1,4-benzoquinol methylase